MASPTKCTEHCYSWLDNLARFSSDGDLPHLLAPALCTAVETGQTSTVAYLLDRGAVVTEELVLLATESKDYSILQLFFITVGTSINRLISLSHQLLRKSVLPSFGNTGNSLSSDSYTFKDPRLTEWFLDHGADPNAPCGRDCTPLSWAVREAPFSCIQMLFDRGGSSQHGQLLHYAAERELPDRCDVVDYLILEKGCSTSINKIMYQDLLDDYLRNMHSDIGSPLHTAAGSGFLDLVQHFVAKGADPLIKDPSGQIPLDRAVQGGHAAVVEFLRSLSTTPSIPRQDFVDRPGFHFKQVPMEDFLKMGDWEGVFHV